MLSCKNFEQAANRFLKLIGNFALNAFCLMQLSQSSSGSKQNEYTAKMILMILTVMNCILIPSNSASMKVILPHKEEHYPTTLTISWQNFAFKDMLPYFPKQASLWFPHRTPISVQVTRRMPPSATACTALSRNVEADPYGSRSIASKRLDGG